jgi:hypothetical protein
VKFVSTKTAGDRAATRERQRRARASTPALRLRFPEISSLRIGFTFRDRGPFAPAPQLTVLHPPANAYFVFACPYTDCDGEFDLSEAVAGLAREKDQRREGQLKCGGHRRVAVGLTDCALTLEYSIEAERG